MNNIDRRCSLCKEVKLLTSFYKNKAQAKGYDYRCKVCQREVAKEYRKIHNNSVRSRDIAFKHKRSIKKDSCKNCGAAENLHMHHPNIDIPLEVITLCLDCHAKEHRIDKWAIEHDKCVRCGTNKIKHMGKGMCELCYQSNYRKTLK